MPQRVLSAELPAHVGETVLLHGWVHRRRTLKNVSFLVVRDRAGLAQVVSPSPHSATNQLLPAPPDTPEESAVSVVGTVVANPAAPSGVEVVKARVDRVGAAETPPFELFRPELKAGLATQLDTAPLAFRHPGRRRALETAAAATRGFRASLERLGFTEIFTPKIVAAATESGANVFPVDYFGRPAYLAQSPQFYKQLMVGVFERVFEVGPVFRAEPSDTGRHLAQYTSLDAELGFITDHRDVMAVVREAVAGMVAEAGVEAAPEVPAEIPSVHFPDALRIANASPDEPDLSPADERALGEWAKREHGSDFLFVTGYPMVKRPFYTRPDPAAPRWSNSFDLLFRGVELVTGGQRLHRYDDYVAALAARGEPVEKYRTYIDAFRYGMPPHGGFAIGLERFVARLLGLGNVREATAFPRDRTRVEP